MIWFGVGEGSIAFMAFFCYNPSSYCKWGCPDHREFGGLPPKDFNSVPI